MERIEYCCTKCGSVSIVHTIGGRCPACHHASVKAEIAAAPVLDAPTPAESLRLSPAEIRLTLAIRLTIRRMLERAA